MRCERDFVFRAKLKDGTGFVYWNCFGEICSVGGKRSRLSVTKAAGHVSCYYHIDEAIHYIDRDTIERYTMYKDRNRRRIFEGDTVRLNEYDEKKVAWVDGAWTLCTEDDCCEPLADWIDNRFATLNVCNVTCI